MTKNAELKNKSKLFHRGLMIKLNHKKYNIPLFKKESSALLNHQGMITIPFLLVSSIILFLILSFFGLAMTFAHISAVQYISYSTARKLSLGGTTDETERKGVAEQHYKDLRGKFFGNAWTGGDGDWFLISTTLTEGLGALGYESSGDYHHEIPKKRNMFYGVGIGFNANIISLAIPFLMNSKESSAVAKISSFLGREPSHNECKNFLGEKIKEKMKDIYPPDYSSNLPKRVGDNGC